ncbi:Uncharacterised protein [Legionella waltersii]|nr:Uncharacterised protein [Legionella waltersii]
MPSLSRVPYLRTLAASAVKKTNPSPSSNITIDLNELENAQVNPRL